jgi:CheY-like chemotaxis protein
VKFADEDEAMKLTAIQILLVEDNRGDARLCSEALKESPLSYDLYVVQDGTQALHFLRREESFANAPRPNVVILDLNLPGKNGLEVLDDIRSDQELHDIPVIIFTSSDSDLDVLIAYKKQANTYLVKPSNISEFNEVIDAITALCP